MLTLGLFSTLIKYRVGQKSMNNLNKYLNNIRSSNWCMIVLNKKSFHDDFFKEKIVQNFALKPCRILTYDSCWYVTLIMVCI